jgi:hypothetical protein
MPNYLDPIRASDLIAKLIELEILPELCVKFKIEAKLNEPVFISYKTMMLKTEKVDAGAIAEGIKQVPEGEEHDVAH